MYKMCKCYKCSMLKRVCECVGHVISLLEPSVVVHCWEPGQLCVYVCVPKYTNERTNTFEYFHKQIHCENVSFKTLTTYNFFFLLKNRNRAIYRRSHALPLPHFPAVCEIYHFVFSTNSV